MLRYFPTLLNWGLRDYGVEGQLGLEKTPEEYVAKMVEVFREVRRVLRDDGTLWLNLGDSYWNNFGGGSSTCSTGNKKAIQTVGRRNKFKHDLYKIKDLVGIPWMVAFALRADGWYLRQDIIWHKPNPMPESVKDRCTKAHEYIFLLSKSQKYYFDNEEIQEEARHESGTRYQYAFGGEKNARLSREGHGKTRPIGYREYNGKRNKRTVWTIATQPFPESHFATFPPKLIEPCILAGCPKDGVVLDPFMGAGTTALVAIQNQRNYIGFELNPEYVKIAERRLQNVQLKIV